MNVRDLAPHEIADLRAWADSLPWGFQQKIHALLDAYENEHTLWRARVEELEAEVAELKEPSDRR